MKVVNTNAETVKRFIDIEQTYDLIVTSARLFEVPHTIHCFLLDDEHPTIVRMEALRLSKYQRLYADAPRVSGANLKWVGQHKMLFAKFKMPWIEPVHHAKHIGPCQYDGFAELEGKCPWYSLMSDRIKHMILVLVHAMPLTKWDQVQLTDVSQDGTYLLPLRMNSCPCLASNSSVLIRRYNKPMRMMLGVEKLYVQGMPSNMNYGGLSDAQMTDLAGNMFHVLTAMQVIAGTIMVYNPDDFEE